MESLAWSLFSYLGTHDVVLALVDLLAILVLARLALGAPERPTRRVW